MDDVTDEQLVEMFQTSDEMRHLDVLVHRHISRVRAMVYPMVLNHADADEITQEIFIRMANGIRRFRQSARFFSWLYRIAVNTVRSFLHRRARRPLEHRAELPDQETPGASPDHALATRETDAGISQALASLTPALRSAITLTAIEGMDIREAARIEGCLTATLYWRIHEARRLIRKQLEKQLTP